MHIWWYRQNPTHLIAIAHDHMFAPSINIYSDLKSNGRFNFIKYAKYLVDIRELSLLFQVELFAGYKKGEVLLTQV